VLAKQLKGAPRGPLNAPVLGLVLHLASGPHPREYGAPSQPTDPSRHGREMRSHKGFLDDVTLGNDASNFVYSALRAAGGVHFLELFQKTSGLTKDDLLRLHGCFENALLRIACLVRASDHRPLAKKAGCSRASAETSRGNFHLRSTLMGLEALVAPARRAGCASAKCSAGTLRASLVGSDARPGNAGDDDLCCIGGGAAISETNFFAPSPLEQHLGTWEGDKIRSYPAQNRELAYNGGLHCRWLFLRCQARYLGDKGAEALAGRNVGGKLAAHLKDRSAAQGARVSN
ncbi:unnamed protein product, partial [Prorocentrum cordatum]